LGQFWNNISLFLIQKLKNLWQNEIHLRQVVIVGKLVDMFQ
jgi:hypothetical protein